MIDINSLKLNSTDRLYFDKLDASGLEEMHAYSLDNRLYDFFEFEPFKDKTETENYIKKLEKRMAEGTAIYWFVKLIESNKIIGTVCLTNLNSYRRSAEQGYALDPSYWGKGYIIEIEKSLIQFFFEKLKFHRLYGITMINNDRTKSSCLAVGFKFESVVKDYYFKENEYIDGWSYYLLSNDYENNNKNFNQKNILKSNYKITDVINELKILFEDEAINENTSIDNYYKWDSISHIEVILSIQKKFNYDFSPNEITEIYSVKDIYNILNNN